MDLSFLKKPATYVTSGMWGIFGAAATGGIGAVAKYIGVTGAQNVAPSTLGAIAAGGAVIAVAAHLSQSPKDSE